MICLSKRQAILKEPRTMEAYKATIDAMRAELAQAKR